MPPVCIPGTIANRAHYNELRQKLLAAVSVRSNATWVIDGATISFAETAERIEIERLYCPFLAFHLDINNEPGHRLTMTGPEGTAGFLQAEFGG